MELGSPRLDENDGTCKTLGLAKEMVFSSPLWEARATAAVLRCGATSHRTTGHALDPGETMHPRFASQFHGCALMARPSSTRMTTTAKGVPASSDNCGNAPPNSLLPSQELS